MVTVKIGASSRDFDSVERIDESWINQQIRGLKKDNHPVCVRVTIHEGSLNMTLTTPECPAAGVGGRPPNRDEARAFDLWDKHGLNRGDFQGGNLIAFFKQLRSIVS